MPGETEETATLALEARIFSRYLGGRTVSDDFIKRYCEASRALLAESSPAEDTALVEFVRTHPWSISYLDAACGFLRPQGLLRKKLLIMTAVLEASPDYANHFLPRDTPQASLILRLVALGLRAVACAIVGSLLYPFAVRS